MRKLASIQKIWNIEQIQGADNIELVSVLGWKCVTKKGIFKKYDLCVYFEIDSFLPVNEKFEFLRDSSYKKNELNGEGFLLRTRKFKGQISQGLVLPLSILDFSLLNFDFVNFENKNNLVGYNVSKLLGIKKWEVAEVVTGFGNIKADFPTDITKTDEIRVQTEPKLIDEFKGKYYISTKLDGTSMTIYFKNGEFGICSNNFEIKDDDASPFWRFFHKNNFDEKIKAGIKNLGLKNIAIQGEFCGEGIQGNKLKLLTPNFFIFNLIDLNSGKRLGLYSIFDFCAAAKIPSVPIEEVGDFFPYKTIDDLIKRAKGKYLSGNNKEGIVIRPVNPVKSEIIDGWLSMKVINNDYLLGKK